MMPHPRHFKGFAALDEADNCNTTYSKDRFSIAQHSLRNASRANGSGCFSAQARNRIRFRGDMDDNSSGRSDELDDQERMNGNFGRKVFKPAQKRWSFSEDWDQNPDNTSRTNGSTGKNSLSKELKSADSDSKRANPFPLPEGCKIGKGFGFSKEQDDYNSRNEPMLTKTYAEYHTFNDGQRKKTYLRSKSNLDEGALDWTGKQPASQYNRIRNSHGRRGSWDDEDFTTSRNLPRRDVYESRPDDRSGFGRGRKSGYDAPPRPCFESDRGSNGISDRDYNVIERGHDIDFAREPRMNNHSSGQLARRFKITKASALFGPIEEAEPSEERRNSDTNYSYDSGDARSGGVRKFLVAKARDVFPNSRSDMESESHGRPSRWRQRNGGDWNGAAGHNRCPVAPRFAAKHAGDAFGREPPVKSRSPSLVDESRDGGVGWPYCRFNGRADYKPSVGRQQMNSTTNGRAMYRKSPELSEEDTELFGQETVLEETDQDQVQCENGLVEENACGYVNNAEGRPSRENTISPYAAPMMPSGQPNLGVGENKPNATVCVKPSVLSIYEQYEQFDFDDSDYSFLKCADNVAPVNKAGATFGDIRTRLSGLSITESPAVGSSQGSSPFMWSVAP